MSPFDVVTSMDSPAPGSVLIFVSTRPFDVDVASAKGGESGGSVTSILPLLLRALTEDGGASNTRSIRPLLVVASRSPDLTPIPAIARWRCGRAQRLTGPSTRSARY